MQIVEYLRAFISTRTVWGRLDSLMIIPGTFGLLERQPLIEAGRSLRRQHWRRHGTGTPAAPHHAAARPEIPHSLRPRPYSLDYGARQPEQPPKAARALAQRALRHADTTSPDALQPSLRRRGPVRGALIPDLRVSRPHYRGPGLSGFYHRASSGRREPRLRLGLLTRSYRGRDFFVYVGHLFGATAYGSVPAPVRPGEARSS